MLSTEPASEMPLSTVTTHRYQEDISHMDDKPYHVVIKPTPHRLHGDMRGPPEVRPRFVANFGGIGTGAFTAYIPNSRQHQEASPNFHLVQSTMASPGGVWTAAEDADPRNLTVHDSSSQLDYKVSRDRQQYSSHGLPQQVVYLSRAIKHEPLYVEHNDSDENCEFSDQESHPIDLRNDSKRFRDDCSPNVPKYSPKQEDISYPVRNKNFTTQENGSEDISLQSRFVSRRDERIQDPYTSKTPHRSTSPESGNLPHNRQESVIMKNSLYRDNPDESPEGAEYMRYTYRNHTARAEIFEMKRSYAPVGDVMSHLTGDDDTDGSFMRGTDESPDVPAAVQSDSDVDEEIDVVSDDYLPIGGNTDEEDQYLGDRSEEDSQSTKEGDSERVLDFRVSAMEALPSSVSPSSSDARSLGTSPSSGQTTGEAGPEDVRGVDPQDIEAGWGVFTVEDLLLRNRVLVILWSLLGEGRLLEVGYPRAPVHRVLWLTVDVCCSVAGMKSAAAVPLTSDHNCREDMLCFRDHTHRFLEVCAPTRDMWKQFGWAGLTVDAVVRKIYEEELRPRLSKLPAGKLPPVIQRALLRLDRLEELLEHPGGGGDVKISLPPVGTSSSSTKLPPPATDRSTRQDAHQPSAAKKKRGRPAKVNQKTDPGRIERVMLWRFLLNLLEDPRNKPCIHWVQREEGIFRILNTDWLARLWGRRHGNPRMTYEKMARAMRTYYRSKVLQPVPRTRNLPRKLIYKFNPAVIHKVSSTKYAPFSDRGLNYNTTPGS